MQPLAKFGFAHQKLDSSRILLLPENALVPTKVSLVKIGMLDPGWAGKRTDRVVAYLDECQLTESTSARPLGIIAFEMMEKGSPPETKGGLILSNPEKWSPEASNFLYVTSWGTLKDIESVRRSCPILFVYSSDKSESAKTWI